MTPRAGRETAVTRSCSSCLDQLEIAQNRDLLILFDHARLDDVADADDADQVAVVDHTRGVR
jgi:hypothetical protein